jgi:CRP-like cAMP-binding protein
MSQLLSAQDKISTFFNNKKSICFSNRQCIIQPYEQPKFIYFIKAGNVRQFDISLSGSEIVTNVFKPGSYFSLSYLFNQTTNKYCYQAVGDVQLKISDSEEVLEFLQSDNEVLLDIISRLLRGTDGVLERMCQLMGGSGKTRLLQELLIQLARFGISQNNGGVHLELTITELAARAGLSRETTSRIIHELQDKGLVEIKKNHVYIYSKDKLEIELNKRD